MFRILLIWPSFSCRPPWRLKVVQACADRGIPGVIIQCAGFAEIGAKGKILQDQLVEISRRTGIRIWGPNCMGLVDAVHKKVFSFISAGIWDGNLLPGSVSLIVQSGMLSAGFLIDMMTRDKIGVSKVCSIGNKVDVNECDILEYLLEDPHTAVIGLYLESIKEGRRFFEICKNAKKPVVVLQGGKSEKGARAAMSHTAGMAGNSAIIKGALTQAGVVQADDFKQMMDFSHTLTLFPNIPRASARTDCRRNLQRRRGDCLQRFSGASWSGIGGSFRGYSCIAERYFSRMDACRQPR